MATNREEKLALLHRAGEVLCGARTLAELKRFAAAFREGIDAGRGAATFAPSQLSFERRHNSSQAKSERGET